ncbi:uncharacterized protein LOC124148798 [Haliotis rufescens]|uniref:uncharacterized protein LOC124148798 n=1 Tax=Haliotis rufescens TaxID=6454 RepID=UPI00201F9079|nr:uncharacterized protein LOC124148798 [Haliotis rufescens]
MLNLFVFALLLVFCPSSSATTCTVCKTTYEAARDAGGATDAEKCTALQEYLTCLETSAMGDAGCPPATADAAQIGTDYTGASCSFTDTCLCQKLFWETDQSADAAAVCTAAQAYIVCLKGKTAATCDGSGVMALATGVEARMTALTTDCVITTACQCEIDAAKADISDDTKKCTAYKAQYACVYSLATAPCDAGTTITTLQTSAAASVTGATSCAFDDTCLCQRVYDAATKTTDADKCTAHKDQLSCLRTSKSAGCDGTTTKSAVAMTSETARATLPVGDCPALTASCQCEVDAAKGDADTDAKFCTVLMTLKTCLSAITTVTEAGCTSALAQAALATDTAAKITTAACSSAAYVTIAMTSLFVSGLASIIL